ncbi:Y-family DNA polymerase [Parvibaculum sp.]|uniref:Y-family DNA polymerase n=1 Tax=Parvibaculum sp. TaxID=2024848 RepID=UPI003BA8B8DC
MQGEKRIAALWLPFWPIERLYRDLGRRHPELLERPRALARAGAGGLRIMACDNRAKEAGVEQGQPLPDARALCPSLEVHPADSKGDREALQRIARWCIRYTPWTAADPVGRDGEPDGIFLDITGCAHLFGGEDALLREVRSRFEGLALTIRCAIASTPGAAWAVVRYGPHAFSIIAPGEEADALRDLPVAALRLDKPTTSGLMRLGLKQAGDLYGKPRAPIAARFGADVSRRLDEALGFEREPISPDRPDVLYRASLSFPEELTQIAHIEEAVLRVADGLCKVLLREQQGARRLELLLFRVDGEVTQFQAGTGRPSHEAAHLARLFREKLAQAGDDFDAGCGIEAIALICVVVEPLSPMQGGFNENEAHLHDLERFLDRVSNRLGRERILRLEPRSSHVPEGAVADVPALNGITPAMRGWQMHTQEHRASMMGGTMPRPLRLLRMPEPVDVVAEVPEGPPRIFRWRRIAHRVVRTEGPERIAPEWWRGNKQQTRDYYRVEDGEGRRFWLFRDGLYFRDNEAPRWFMHGVFE